jgi:hypothetical protein
MSAEQVALIPRCAECGERWLPDDEDHWRAYFDTDDVLIFYCPHSWRGLGDLPVFFLKPRGDRTGRE